MMENLSMKFAKFDLKTKMSWLVFLKLYRQLFEFYRKNHLCLVANFILHWIVK